MTRAEAEQRIRTILILKGAINTLGPVFDVILDAMQDAGIFNKEKK
jgi:hypothetical protein